MSVRVMTWVWDHSPVGGTDRLVLLAVADCAADDGTNAWPSLATLARKVRLDERTVRRIVRRLEEGGHLLVDVAAGPGGTNRYTVVMGGSVPPGDVPPGQAAPRAERPAPRAPAPPPPGRSCAPRTSLNVQRTSRRAGTPAAPAPPPGGAALPVRDGQCPRHRGQRAGRCGPCRSEQLAGGMP